MPVLTTSVNATAAFSHSSVCRRGVLLVLRAAPQQLGVEVLGLRVVLGVGEHLEVDLVELLGVRERLGVLGLRRLRVIRASELARHRGGVVVALLRLGGRQHLLVLERAVQLDEVLDLLDLVGVAARRPSTAIACATLYCQRQTFLFFGARFISSR